MRVSVPSDIGLWRLPYIPGRGQFDTPLCRVGHYQWNGMFKFCVLIYIILSRKNMYLCIFFCRNATASIKGFSPVHRHSHSSWHLDVSIVYGPIRLVFSVTAHTVSNGRLGGVLT